MTTRDSTGLPSAGPILTDPISTDPVPANPVPTNPVPAGPIPSSLAEVAASVPAAPVRGSSTDALPEHRATGAVQAGQADTGQIPGRQLELLSLAALARTLHLQGDERLAGVAEQYLGLALHLDDDAAQAEGLSYLSGLEQRQGLYLQATEHLRQEALMRARLGDWAGQVECLSNLGTLHATLGDHAEALTTLFQCQQLSVQYAEVSAESRAACLVNIGHTYLALRQYPQALEYLVPGLETAAQAGDTDTQLSALSELGLVYKAQKQFPLAISTLSLGLELAQATNAQELIDLTDNLGQVYSDMGDFARARTVRRVAAPVTRPGRPPGAGQRPAQPWPTELPARPERRGTRPAERGAGGGPGPRHAAVGAGGVPGALSGLRERERPGHGLSVPAGLSEIGRTAVQ